MEITANHNPSLYALIVDRTSMEVAAVEVVSWGTTFDNSPPIPVTLAGLLPDAPVFNTDTGLVRAGNYCCPVKSWLVGHDLTPALHYKNFFGWTGGRDEHHRKRANPL